ncbi:DUF5791 family protein [Natrialbaceae archaeon GCM10025810]|uniref:DUF5791 family protein n=1 Tax=Halovalidus salilacus TaxID=3075124 RepID=UPI003615D274
MFYDQRTTVPDAPSDLREEYEADLEAAVEDVGLEAAAAETDVDEERLEALLAGDSPELTLEEAARIQSLAEGEPDPVTIETMATEHLLLGMSTAVLDVEAVESELNGDLEAKEIQQKIERRAPMTLEEFARIQWVIVDRSP